VQELHRFATVAEPGQAMLEAALREYADRQPGGGQAVLDEQDFHRAADGVALHEADSACSGGSGGSRKTSAVPDHESLIVRNSRAKPDV